MNKITLMSTAAVGKMIDKVINASKKFSQDLHAVAIQCALHAREHGDTSLMRRLVDGLENAGATNTQGLRKWFGDCLPVKRDRNGVWDFYTKDSDGYKAYEKRMALVTAKAGDKIVAAIPDDEAAPGGRVCYVDWCSDHPFWTDDAVKQSQRQTIKVIGLTQMFGQVYAIQTQFKKALEAGTFGGKEALAKDFLTKLISDVETFKTEHASELINEAAELERFAAAKGTPTAPEVAPETVQVGGLSTEEVKAA